MARESCLLVSRRTGTPLEQPLECPADCPFRPMAELTQAFVVVGEEAALQKGAKLKEKAPTEEEKAALANKIAAGLRMLGLDPQQCKQVKNGNIKLESDQ